MQKFVFSNFSFLHFLPFLFIYCIKFKLNFYYNSYFFNIKSTKNMDFRFSISKIHIFLLTFFRIQLLLFRLEYCHGSILLHLKQVLHIHEITAYQDVHPEYLSYFLYCKLQNGTDNLHKTVYNTSNHSLVYQKINHDQLL